MDGFISDQLSRRFKIMLLRVWDGMTEGEDGVSAVSARATDIGNGHLAKMRLFEE